MFGQAARSSGMYVAEQANFQRNSFVEDVVREAAQLHCLAIGDSDVINQAGTVADAVGTAVLNGLPDRFFSKALACVNGDIEILALNVVERVDMLFGRKPPSSPARSKPTTPRSRKSTASSAISSETSILRMAHMINPGEIPNSFWPALQPFQNRGDHLLMGQSRTGMKDRSEAGLE